MGSKAEAWTKEKPNVTAATADSHHQSELTGRLSPNSLANKFSANLNYLESMEESLRQVIGMERVRSVALAQQETVSLAQILKVSHKLVLFHTIILHFFLLCPSGRLCFIWSAASGKESIVL